MYAQCARRRRRSAWHTAVCAAKRGKRLQPRTLEFAKYVILFTTVPAETFPAASVLEWYRMRWQVELVSGTKPSYFSI